MSTELDDYLPPPAPPKKREKRSAERAPAAERSAPLASRWGERVVFGAGGLLLGFAAAWLYLEKLPNPVPPVSNDPHGGIVGVGPGASRDLPGSGGGSPSLPSADPALRQRVRDLEGAVAKDPNNYDLLVQLGNAAYDADDSRQAVDAYERALKIRDGDPNVLTDLGVSYRNLGDPEKALALFGRAAKADPKHWPAVFNQIIVYGVDKGDVAKARALLKQLRKDHPEIPSLDKLEAAIEERAKKTKGS
jgi:tetratricopeptide (TPR) repeat protein